MIASRVAKTRAIQTREPEIAKSARSWWLSRPEQHALQTDMSEVTSASPAAKRARLAESRASNVLALQTYRIRVTLPLAIGKYGKRVFDVHQEATFDELHEAI